MTDICFVRLVGGVNTGTGPGAMPGTKQGLRKSYLRESRRGNGGSEMSKDLSGVDQLGDSRDDHPGGLTSEPLHLTDMLSVCSPKDPDVTPGLP